MTEFIKNMSGEFFARNTSGHSLITVTNVWISEDLRHADIFISVLPESKSDAAVNFAKRQRTDLQKFVLNRVKLMHLPMFEIVLDKSGQPNIFYKILIALLLICFFVYVFKFLDRKPNSTEIKISSASTTIVATIANTENKRSLGLSYTEKLDENAGMLFIFDDVNQKNFWMRDMNYDLDIIWLDVNKQVNGFFENVPAASYNSKHPELSKIYHSPDNTKYVLEVNAGTISKDKIKVGDTLDFKY
jgi:uncharacterized membrane protein (UPF0127 family)